jgi:hypothetical protein
MGISSSSGIVWTLLLNETAQRLIRCVPEHLSSEFRVLNPTHPLSLSVSHLTALDLGRGRDEMPTETRSERQKSSFVIESTTQNVTEPQSREAEAHEVKWEKALWRKQPFPDNYVPPSFLAELNALRTSFYISTFSSGKF